MMQTIVLVAFQYSGYWFAVEARHVVAMGKLQSLAAVEQKTINLSNLLSGELPAVQTENFALQMRSQQDDLLLALDNEAQIIELNADSIWPLPPLLQQGRQHPSIKALAWHNDQLLTLLDAEQLASHTSRC